MPVLHTDLRLPKYMLHSLFYETYQMHVQLTQECSRLPLQHINKIQQGATVCRYLFTAKSLYMFRVSIAPIIRST